MIKRNKEIRHVTWKRVLLLLNKVICPNHLTTQINCEQSLFFSKTVGKRLAQNKHGSVTVTVTAMPRAASSLGVGRRAKGFFCSWQWIEGEKEKKAIPNPPVIAYRRNANLRDLLVHSRLSHENFFSQQPAGIKKMQPSTLPHLFFSPRGSNKLCFFTTNEARKLANSISCHSKNLIYLTECKKCHLPPTLYPESPTTQHNYTTL